MSIPLHHSLIKTPTSLTIGFIQMLCVLALLASPVVHAREAGDFEFYMVVPFTEGTTLNFDGKAKATIQDDFGFGLGFGALMTDQVAVRGNMTWNSASYNATRVLDDADNTTELFGGRYDSFSLAIGTDYYFNTGKFTPFVSADLGILFIDSNIPSGRPVSSCWWDPWYGYICDVFQPSFGDDTWFYGVGLGVRRDFGRSNFVKFGYYEEWVDFDNVDDTSSFGIYRFEFGWTVY